MNTIRFEHDIELRVEVTVTFTPADEDGPGEVNVEVRPVFQSDGPAVIENVIHDALIESDVIADWATARAEREQSAELACQEGR